MNDSLIPYQSNLLETRKEFLSRQFYEWERRGRGWQVFDYPVELEPPFRPFYVFDVPQSQVTDDGRKPTFFSNLFERWRRNFSKAAPAPALPNNQLADYQLYLERTNEPDYCQYHNDEFTEMRLVLPKEQKITKSVAEQLLLSFGHSTNPVAFEIVGSKEQIIVQFAATERDSFQVGQQIKSYLPDCSITETEDYLSDAWISGGDSSVIADFGLSHEFMLPLETVSNFDTDLLVSVIGAMANLSDDEVAVFQILFQKAKSDWAEEILDSVRYFDGTPFFSNAPEIIALAKDKISRPLFAAVVRAAARSRHEARTWQIIRNVSAGLSAVSNPLGNELIPLSNDGYDPDYHEQALMDRTSYRCGMILNSEELVSIVHPPSINVRTEKLVRESERTKAVPNLALNHPLILGENVHQEVIRRATLSDEQRTRHIHVIGSSGSGKSTLLLNLIRQDLHHDQGLCVIDPHGDLVDDILANVPDNRINDVVLFDPSDAEYPIGFNVLSASSELEKTLLSSDLIATFRRMSTSWGDVMDSVLANALLAFVESSRGGTLFDLKRFLVEKEFRNEFLSTVQDEGVRYFWRNEFPLITGKPQSSILIRLDSFLRQRLIRNIVCQKENRIDFREVMDKRKVLLIKLSQGLIGEENAYLLGTLLVSKIYQTALSRQDSQDRPFFWLYLDEFQHFITPSMENVLSGARKYNLGLVLAHQEFRQLQSRNQEVASSVLSNCYTRICFRLGDADAERFAGGFSFFDAEALQNLSVGEAIARVERREYDFNLHTFSATKIHKEIAENKRNEITGITRQKYAKAKAEVEASINFARSDETTREGAGKAKDYGAPSVSTAQSSKSPEVAPERRSQSSFSSSTGQEQAKENEAAQQSSAATPLLDRRRPADAAPLVFPNNGEKILHYLRRAEYLSQPQIIALTGLQASNASTALKKLCETGQIKTLDDRRPKIYFVGRTCNPTVHNLLIRDLLVKISASDFAIRAVKFNDSISDLNPDLTIEFVPQKGSEPAPLPAYFELDRGTEGVQELIKKAERYARINPLPRVCFVFERESDMELARARIDHWFVCYAVLDEFTSLKDAAFSTRSAPAAQLSFFR